MKAYAEARLAARARPLTIRDRHLDHFHAVATAHGHTGISDLRLGVALRPDRSNLTAAFEWAATTGRWVLARRAHHWQLPGLHLRRRSAGGAPAHHTCPDANAGHDTTTRRPAARGADHDRGLAHRLGHLSSCGPSSSPRPRVASCERSASSASASSTPFADTRPATSTSTEHTKSWPPQEPRPPTCSTTSPPRLIHWVEGRVAAGHGDFEAGLEGSIAFLAKCRADRLLPDADPASGQTRRRLPDPARRSHRRPSTPPPGSSISTLDIQHRRHPRPRPSCPRPTQRRHPGHPRPCHTRTDRADARALLRQRSATRCARHAEGDDDRARDLL